MSRSPRRGAKGQVLVLFALFLVVLVGATAITVDYGSWLKVRRDYQNLADAAVLAGGGFLSRPVDASKRILARRAAWESLNTQLALGLSTAQLNTLQASNTPFANPQVFNDYRLWVSTPPIDASTKYPGGFTGADDRYLFAWVEKDNPSFFSRVFGQGDRNVSAWATAGVFSGQFAVITLRQNGQAPVSAPSDIDLDGNGTILQVVNGDVGGNWGMKLTAASNLYLLGGADAWLVDYISCGNSCWSTNQISDGPPSNNPIAPVQLPNLVDDPNYPLPAVLTSPMVPATGGTVAVPQATGTENGPPPSSVGNVTITKGTKTASSVGCLPTSPHIGPGWYHDINVSGCLILDPTHNYSDPNDANSDGDFGATDVPSTQQAGIFYITGTMNINNGALVVGDGVSLVLRETSNQPGLIANGDGALDINTGATDGTKGFPPNFKKAAFQTDGSYSYSFNNTLTPPRWVYTANNNDKTNVGVAVYVVKPAQIPGGSTAVDANTDMIQIQAGAAMSWTGVLYAPHDNIILSGQPTHDAIGQFIAWTVKVAGGTTITQTYDGPGESLPRLVEPHLGQ
jgi:hypothetical protein